MPETPGTIRAKLAKHVIDGPLEDVVERDEIKRVQFNRLTLDGSEDLGPLKGHIFIRFANNRGGTISVDPAILANILNNWSTLAPEYKQSWAADLAMWRGQGVQI